LKYWNFKDVAATEEEPESVELHIEGDIVDDDNAWLYEMAGVKAISPNAFKTELAQYENKPITVWVDSYGGDVFAAAGIYNALMEHKGKVTVKIDGKAMSAASIIAMAGGEILMSPVAIMMIHNPLTYAEGYATDLRKAADVLDTVKESIMNAYTLKTGKSRAKISQLMDDETYMDARSAIKNGFADSIMYADKGKQEEVANIGFSRSRILNSASKSVKKLFDFERDIENGVNPGNISTETAPESTAWQKPTLQDFTDKGWADLSDSEKRDIAKHFAWAAEMPPNTFGDLKFPHHDPKTHKIVWSAVANAGARLEQSNLTEADKQKVRQHLSPHYKAFGKTAPWEQDKNLAKAKLALQLAL
jgi:ATP-dependent Clp protease protease subunit